MARRRSRAGGLLVVVALLLVAVVGPARAAPPEARRLDQLDIRTWATDEGLPHDTVLSLALGPDGALWAGTWGGLARFDGFEFRVLDRGTSPLITDNGMLALARAGDGSLIVGMQGGRALRVVDTTVGSVAGPTQGIAGNVLAVHATADALWIGVEGDGLWRFREGRLDRLGDPRLDRPTTVLALAPGQDGSVLVGTSQGAFRIPVDAGGPVDLVDGAPGAPTGQSVFGIAESADGTLWIGTDREVMRRAPEGDWQRLAEVAVQTLIVDRSGRAWVGTAASGVLRIAGDAVERLDRRGGLPDDRVRAILEDGAGGVWLGTNAGLVVLRDLPFRGLTARQGLAGDYVRSLLELPDGRVLVAGSGGLFEVEGAEVRAVSTRLAAEGAAPESLLSLAADRDGSVWIGTYADGLRRRDPAGVAPVPERLRLPGQAVRALLVAGDGSLWVGTREGLARFDPREGSALPIDPAATGTTVLALHQDPEGQVWAGTTAGLRRFTAEGRALPVPETDGFAARTAYAFIDGEPGELWVGSSEGLLRIAEGALQAVGREQGLPFFRVLQIGRDDSGHLWLGSERGVFRVAEQDLRAVALGRVARVEGRSFGRDDGMPSRQCNSGAGPTAIRTASGEVWFATARGVAIVDPRRIEERPRVAPPVRFERVAVDDRDVPVDRRLDVGPGRHTLQARFGAVDLVNPAQLEFAWRIVGQDLDWRLLGGERSLRINDLAVGDHVLEVTARYAGGAWSEMPARFEYVVSPALGERPWFLPAMVALALLVAGLVFRLRTRALRVREAELSRRVDEQTASLARKMQRLSERDAETTQLLAEIERKSRELERLAREDALTGLANRRHFDERFDAAVAASTDAGPALLLLDVDHFKQINDRHSHRVGDAVIVRVADLLRETFPDGLAGRYGGEEFVVLLEDGDLDAARARAEELRAAIESEPWATLSAGLAVTVSIGVAIRDAERDPGRIASMADDRLYEAKRGGRNRVC